MNYKNFWIIKTHKFYENYTFIYLKFLTCHCIHIHFISNHLFIFTIYIKIIVDYIIDNDKI